MRLKNALTAVLAAVLAGMFVAGGLAFALPAGSGEQLTACLTEDGRLVRVALGSEPLPGSPSGPSDDSGPQPVVVEGAGTAPTVRVTPGPGSLTVRWDAVDGSTWHQWQYRVQGSRAWARSFGKNRYEAEVTGLVDGVTYQVEVRAFIGGLYRDWTRVVATVGEPTVAPPPSPTGCDQVVSWSQGESAGGQGLPWGLHNAATFRLTTDGCSAGLHRWVVHEQWGTELVYRPSQCLEVRQPRSGYGGVTAVGELGIGSELPTGYTYFYDGAGGGEYRRLALPQEGLSGASCRGEGGAVYCYFAHNGGDFAAMLASEPVSTPVTVWRMPSAWQPPMSPSMSPPAPQP